MQQISCFSLKKPSQKNKNEIKKILPFDCSIYSQINFRNKTKKNLPPFYELMNYDTSNDMIFPLSC